MSAKPMTTPSTSYTVALRNQWHTFAQGRLLDSSAPRPASEPECLLWLDPAMIPELTTFSGDLRYVREVLQQELQDTGTFAEPVRVQVHATRSLSGSHQVLYSTVPESQWLPLAAYIEAAQDAIPTYHLMGLGFSRCHGERAVLICMSAYFYLLWEERGTLQLRASPVSLEADVNAGLRNVVLQSAPQDLGNQSTSAKDFPFKVLEFLDLRAEADDSLAPLDFDSWWPKGLTLKVWTQERASDGLRRQFAALTELLDSAPRSALCNPPQTQALLLSRQHWASMTRLNAVAAMAALGVSAMMAWNGWGYQQAAHDLDLRISALRQQAEQTQSEVRALPEASPQAEFLSQALASGFRQTTGLANWLTVVKSTMPPEMQVLGLAAELEDRGNKAQGPAAIQAMRLDATFEAGTRNKSAVLSHFVRELEAKGFVVRSRKSPTQGNATDNDSGEVVTYLIGRAATGAR